jgi:hypothetical protein
MVYVPFLGKQIGPGFSPEKVEGVPPEKVH